MSNQPEPSQNPKHDHEEVVPVVLAPKKGKFSDYWRKMGGGSLTFSIILHAAIILVGGYIFFIRPAEKEKSVDFQTSGGKSGQKGPSDYKAEKKREAVPNASIQRVVAQDVESTTTLPELSNETLSAMPDLSSTLGAEKAMSNGAQGPNFGPNSANLGLPNSGAVGMPSFGFDEQKDTALIGTFYDAKQTQNNEEIKEDQNAFLKNIKDFLEHGWSQARIEKYYRAKQQLYQTRLYLPVLDAGLAPQSFRCEKEVKSSRWFAIYRGTIVAPKTGKFRFVGAGDDMLCVRFNEKLVFDFGYIQAAHAPDFTMGANWINSQDVNFVNSKGKKELDSDWKKRFRNSCMNPPFKFYRYSTMPNVNTSLGGMAEGPIFEVVKDNAYPIEIFISEVPGGLFQASLLIKEEGAKYQTVKYKWKDSRGIDREEDTEVLPLFRTDNDPLPPLPKASYNLSEQDQAPPFDPTGPIWKVKKTSLGIMP